eukprot:1318838-Amorphochlora_amoeboformis.AAC.1
MMHGVLAGGKREPDSREVISHEIRKKRKALKLDSIVWKLDVFPTRDEFDHSLEGRNPIGSILLMSSNTVLQLVETFNSAFLDSSISKYEWGLRVRNVTYRDLREQLNCKSSSSSNGDEEGEYSCIQLGEMCIGARPCWISGFYCEYDNGEVRVRLSGWSAARNSRGGSVANKSTGRGKVDLEEDWGWDLSIDLIVL